MEAGALQDRLSSNAKAFDGLLSLIPSKLYYGEDSSDQWKRKKQSKAEAKAARRGKLDPNSALNRSAKEVMDERARKRKLEQMSDNESNSSLGVDEREEKEQPHEGLQIHDDEAPAKKQKLSKAKQAKKSEKRIKAQEKRAEKRKAKEVKEETTARPTSSTTSDQPEQSSRDDIDEAVPATELLPTVQTQAKRAKKDKALKRSSDHVLIEAGNEKSKSESLQDDTQDTTQPESTEPQPEVLASQPSPVPHSSPETNPASPTFDHSPQHEPEGDQASIDTSVNDNAVDAPIQKRDPIKLIDQDRMVVFRQRLQARLAELREARGAGPDGKPVRSREDLIEARRLEQAKKKAHKKELKRKAKEEEDRQREEALKAASSRSSPLGSLSPSIHGETNFSFGRIAFSDGAQMSRDGSYILNNAKKKGPSDPKTALIKIENQKARLAAMDEDKRKEVLEKETWMAARKRAEGERVKNDEALIKKTAKRKEKAKKKSEKEWKARTKAVEQAKAAKQRKREDNIRKRKEDKALGKMGKKLKGGAGKKTFGKSSVKKTGGRSGFEGRGGLF